MKSWVGFLKVLGHSTSVSLLLTRGTYLQLVRCEPDTKPQPGKWNKPELGVATWALVLVLPPLASGNCTPAPFSGAPAVSAGGLPIAVEHRGRPLLWDRA